MQLPKSIADIPFFNCSLGSVLSDGIITAMKSEQLIILDELDELIKDDILFIIWDLSSEEVICSIFSIHLFCS